MKIRIILLGAGAELDHQTVTHDEQFDVADEIFTAIGAWQNTLAPGDTIKIVEVE